MNQRPPMASATLKISKPIFVISYFSDLITLVLKGQIISKGLLVSSNSPKKWTNEFVFTTTTKSFRNYLTFKPSFVLKFIATYVLQFYSLISDSLGSVNSVVFLTKTKPWLSSFGGKIQIHYVDCLQIIPHIFMAHNLKRSSLQWGLLKLPTFFMGNFSLVYFIGQRAA